jgi:Streptococcus thermophilus bacteriophage Gp111 protein
LSENVERNFLKHVYKSPNDDIIKLGNHQTMINEEEVTMRNVMKKAWEIARDGARKFGGSVKEYFAEALRMAWAIVKKGMETVEKIIIVADKDTMVYHVYGERNGKIFRKLENLKSNNEMKEAYAYLAHDLGIRTLDRYMIENGVKRFFDTKTW